MRPPALALPLLIASMTACGGKHQAGYEVGQAAASTGSAQALLDEAEALWAERGDPAKLQAALDRFEQVVAADPTNRAAYQRLVRGYYFLGDGHLEERDAKIQAWDKAITWGKKCMGLNSEFVQLLEKGEAEADAARAFTIDDVPCLYWTASALGKWAKASGMGKTLKNIPTVKAWISRVEELDPDYFYAGPARYWGAYYAAIPSFAGQDLDKSKAYFDQAIQAWPNHFGNRVLLAEFWAVKTQNGQVFDEQIEFVLSHPPDVMPEIVPEQEAEQRKARRLKERRAELILE